MSGRSRNRTRRGTRQNELLGHHLVHRHQLCVHRVPDGAVPHHRRHLPRQGPVGGLKALWVICLIFFPFVTALVYLIARGPGMAERQSTAMDQRQQAQDAYIQSVAGVKSPSAEIAQAKALLDAGTIDQAEYDTLKARALA